MPHNLEDFLITEKLVKISDLPSIHRFMAENGVNLGTALMYLNYLGEEQLSQVLGRVGIRRVFRRECQSTQKMKRLIKDSDAFTLQVFPFAYIEESGQRVLVLAMTDPLDRGAIDRIEAKSHFSVQPVFVSLEDLQQLFQVAFGRGLEIFPAEITGYNKIRTSERLQPVKQDSPPVSENSQVEGLVSLLIEKGLIRREEWVAKLKKIR